MSFRPAECGKTVKKLLLIPLALEQSSHLSSFYGFIKLHPLEECAVVLARVSSSYSISFSPWPKENDDTDEEIMRTSVKGGGFQPGKEKGFKRASSRFLPLCTKRKTISQAIFWSQGTKKSWCSKPPDGKWHMKDDLLVGVFGLAAVMKPPIVLIRSAFSSSSSSQDFKKTVDYASKACAKDISCFVAEKLEKLHHWGVCRIDKHQRRRKTFLPLDGYLTFKLLCGFYSTCIQLNFQYFKELTRSLNVSWKMKS